MRALLLVMDGLGDIREGNRKTPLESAETPNMDMLAKEGATGFFIPYKKGIPVGSDIGHLALFGYDESFYIGRGPYEAMGYGIELKEGSIAFRANLATFKDGKIIDRRAGRISSEEHKEIGKVIDGLSIDGVRLRYYPSAEHRAIAVLEGENLSDKISDTDSHEVGEITPSIPLSEEGSAKRTAELINKFSEKIHEILDSFELNLDREKQGKLKGNYVLFRGAGKHKEVRENFKQRFGISSLAIAGKPLYKGVAKYVGMELANSPKGDSRDELKEKARIAVESNHELVFLHVKATDTAGHDGKWEEKKKAIERVDEIISPLRDSFDVIAITGDHSTPCSYKAHSGHPVPLLLWGKNVRRDETEKFSEYEALKGSLEMRGEELMYSIVNYMEKAKLKGN